MRHQKYVPVRTVATTEPHPRVPIRDHHDRNNCTHSMESAVQNDGTGNDTPAATPVQSAGHKSNNECLDNYSRQPQMKQMGGGSVIEGHVITKEDV